MPSVRQRAETNKRDRTNREENCDSGAGQETQLQKQTDKENQQRIKQRKHVAALPSL